MKSLFLSFGSLLTTQNPFSCIQEGNGLYIESKNEISDDLIDKSFKDGEIIKLSSYNEMKKEEVKELHFNFYASKLLMKKGFVQSFKCLKINSIICCNEKEIEWINKVDVIQIEKIEIIRFNHYASKILMKLKKNIEMNELYVQCDEKEQIAWIENFNELSIKKVKKLSLLNYASKLLMKMKEGFEVEKELYVSCNEEEQIAWVFFKRKPFGILVKKEFNFKKYGFELLRVLDEDEFLSLKSECFDDIELAKRVKILLDNDIYLGKLITSKYDDKRERLVKNVKKIIKKKEFCEIGKDFLESLEYHCDKYPERPLCSLQ